MINDPWIRLHSKRQTLSVVLAALAGLGSLVYIGSFFIPAFSVLRNTISNSVWISSVFIFIFLVSTLWFLAERNVLQHRLRQHQKLLLSNSDLLAQEQPPPNEHALSLPVSIVLHPNVGIMRLLSGMFALMVIVCAGLAIWALIVFFTTPYNAYYTGNDPIFATFAGSIALFFGLLWWFLWSRSRYWVNVTETGLEARFNGHRMQILWSDAHFFSVEGIIGSNQPRIYTLSGEQGSVIWMQLIVGTQTSFYRPVLPFDLYQQRSKALLEVVVARTGLPLYDMRLPANKWYF